MKTIFYLFVVSIILLIIIKYNSYYKFINFKETFTDNNNKITTIITTSPIPSMPSIKINSILR